MWCKKSRARWRTLSKGRAQKIKIWHWNCRSLVPMQQEAGGGKIMSGNITLSQIILLSLSWDWSANLLLHSLYTPWNFYTFRHYSKDISLHGSAVLSQTSDWVARVRSRGQGCDWKWQKRISGQVEGPDGPTCSREPAGQRAGQPSSICQSPAWPAGRLVNSPCLPSLLEMMLWHTLFTKIQIICL